jgi:spore coat protein JC
MFIYEKRYAYPIKDIKKDLKMAKVLYAQLGGQNGELGACLRYFAQSFTMPDERGRNLLKDIATEEMGHVEMIFALIEKLKEGATIEEIENAGLSCNYAIFGDGIGLHDCAGNSFTTAGIGVTGDYKADLTEDMAAEERARVTYEKLINLTNDYNLINVLLFLRQREIVHYNRFKEMLEVYNKEK